jgi:prophage regulatory protein
MESNAMHDFDPYLRLREIERLTGLSKSTVYRLEALGQFPRRVKLSERASAWRASEVTRWLADRPRANSKSAA